MDARWLDVEDDFNDAIEHLSNANIIFKDNGFDRDGIDGYKERMAFMHAMQSGYTSIEDGLVKIFNMLGEAVPTGDSWHTSLIRRASKPISGDRPAIISNDVAEKIDQLKRFRHVAVHNYNNFRPQEADAVVMAAVEISSVLIGELDRFKTLIDGDSSHPKG